MFYFEFLFFWVQCRKFLVFIFKTPMILSGKIVAEKIYQDLKEKIAGEVNKPKLAVILVGKNSPSLRYIKQKQKWAEFVGIDFELINFDDSVSETEILDTIKKLNNDNTIDGFMVQTPLPKHIDVQKVILAIDPKKDVDGFHPVNQGKIVVGDNSGLPACTPAGVLELCKYYDIELTGKNIVIIGRSNIVGKPLSNLLINKQATVTVCNSKTKDIASFTKNADIVITALWVPHFLKKEMIGEKTIVIDVGFSVIDGKIYGDADFESISSQGNNITPVPGWVGVLTVAGLMKNTFQAFSQKK